MFSRDSFHRLRSLANELPESITKAQFRLQILEQQSVALKAEGIIHATGHWRKGKYFCLVYPSRKGEPRKFEYIGIDPKKIEKSQAALYRAAEFDALEIQMALLEEVAEQCSMLLADILNRLKST